MLRQLGQRLGLHRAQEHRRVDAPVQAPTDRVAGGREIQRRADRGDRAQLARRLLAAFLRPAQQRVAAQRDTDRMHRPLAPLCQPRQHPADLLEVAGVVGARRPVELAGAAAEMRQRAGPAQLLGALGKGLRVVARRGALQAVEDHQQRRLRARRRVLARLQPVDVDEVAVRRGPALTRPDGGAARRMAAREQRRPDRLQLPAGQPGRRQRQRPRRSGGSGGRAQCSIEGSSPTSCAAPALPGLA